MINDPSLTPPAPDDDPTNGDSGGEGIEGGEVAAGVAVATLPGGLAPYDGPRIEISDEMRTSYLGYAMSTIVSRALPDVRDGFKPVQRRILYAMRELGLSPNSRHLKSAKVVGECMGNYHPHGDQALYGTMVRMAQPFSLRYPLVDGQGNFGSVDDDPPAAMRYCVINSSLIATASGLQAIGTMGGANGGEDISARVLSINGHVNTASKWFDCGVFPTRRVVTRRGYEITGTTNHPLLVCVPSETGDKRVSLVWKTIADLQTGDYLVLDRSETLWPEQPVDLRSLHPQYDVKSRVERHILPDTLTEDFAFLLGTLTATKTNGFAGTDIDNAFFAALGLRHEASKRVVPDVVLRSPQKVVAAFLRGLFEGSGTTTSARSHALLHQVQTILLRFGIVSTLNEVAAQDYCLVVAGTENTTLFHSKIHAATGQTVEPQNTNRYLFEPVTLIEDAGEQNVYSIRVDSPCHSFVANGFVNHNTEARLTPLAMEMMEDIEKDTVNFIPTYDNERREPSILPGKFPNLLCNGGSGIAVGMATNLPPHNLREVADAAMFLLEKPDATLEQLMQIMPGPDFPTSGLLLGSKGIKSAYATGRGIITMQAKTLIEPMDNGKNAIVVTELPYQVIKTRIIEQIADHVKEKRIDGITAVNDYSDKNGMRIVVELRRDVMPQKVLNYLLKHTPLRLNFGIILLSLVDNGRGPKTLPLKSLLQEYLDHRRVIITRRTRFELGRAKARAHILEGLQIAVSALDEVIQIIRRSASSEQARSRLIERFDFSGIQAEAILNMQLRQLTGLEQDKIEGEYKDLLKEIARLEDILSDPRRVTAMIKADLKYLKDKFGDDRRTRLIPAEAEEINIEDLIAEEEMLITITRDGYVKRMKMDTFPSQHRGGRGRTAGRTKEEDNFEHFFKASTHDYLLFFTDRGRVYRLKAFEVPETSRQAMGTAIINLIQVMPDEHITATLPIRDLRTAEGFLFMATERGEVKRTKISEYANLRANGLVTFNLNDGDKLSWVKHTQGDAAVVITTVRGMAIQFNETDVRASGRASGGVRGISLQDANDRVVSVDVLTDPASDLLVVSEKGLGKRTPMSAYRNQTRGGKGLKTMNLTERTGSLVASCVVTRENQDTLRLMIVTENGIVIRMDVSQVKTTDGRSTQGVKLIELGESDRVKTVEYIDEAKKEGEVISAE